MSLPETEPGRPNRDSSGKFARRFAGKTGAGSVSLEEHLEDARNAFMLASNTIEVLQAEKRTITNTLEESRKIAQERENQLTELRRLLRLSRMSDANARGILQQIRDYLGGDSDESALSKVERMYRESIDMEGKYESSIQLSKDACRERNEAVAELQAANLEIERLRGELFAAGIDREELLRKAQEQASVSRVQFACTGLIIAIVASGIAFFVGRWAK